MIPQKKKFENPVEQYAQILLKRKKTLILAFLSCILVTLLYNYSQVPMYRSTAKILIELQTPRFIEDQSYFQSFTTDFYLTRFEILKSMPILEKVIESLDLTRTYKRAESPLSRFVHRFGIGTSPRDGGLNKEQLYGALRSSLRISPITQTGIVEISVQGPNPTQCQKIATELVDVYIEDTHESTTEAATKAGQYLQLQLDKINGGIRTAQEKLEKFEKEAGIAGIAGRKDDFDTQQLDQFSSKLMETRQRRWELESRFNSLQSLSEKRNVAGLSIPSLQNDTMAALTKQLLENEQQLARYQLQDYKEKHPLIVSTKANIEFIKKQVLGEAAKWADATKAEIGVLRRQEDNLAGVIAQHQNSIAGNMEQGADYGYLKREVDIQNSLYESYNEQLKKTSLVKDFELHNIRKIDPARVPARPFAPNRKTNLLLGLFVGLALGAFLVFLQEYLDNTIKTREDVENFLNAPLLGIVPIISDKGAETRLFYARSDQNSVLSDAYRTLRTNLQFFHGERPMRTLLVTSAGPSEGKSTTAANLAIALVQMGKKVLLVDTDLRKPVLHKTFKITDDYGVTSLFAGIKERNKLIHPTSIERLMVFPSGPIPPNPTELLASSVFRQVFENLRNSFDFVLFDSPPVLAVADATILASLTDGVVLVINSGHTTIKLCQLALAQLEQAKAHITGCVLNRFDYREAGYYRYYNRYYKYGYTQDGKKAQKDEDAGKDGNPPRIGRPKRPTEQARPLTN